MKKIVCMLLLISAASIVVRAQTTTVRYVDEFKNSNHPQVAYWFFAANMMDEKAWKQKIDSFALYSKYTLIFLTERNGCNFYDIKTMHPVFAKLVPYAHQKGLQVGLQIWKRDFETKIENADRLIQDGEVILDENGHASYMVKAKGAREMKTLLRSELFRVYAFRKTGDGFYDPASLQNITAAAKADTTRESVAVSINAGKALKGYTAFIMTQHYYNSCSNYSQQAKDMLQGAFRAYADIPFDAIGLDEYKNLKIAQQRVLESARDVFRERLYSEGMGKKISEWSGKEPGLMLLNMRYAPEGKPELRMGALNHYMDLVRFATLPVEASVYDLGKRMYGKDAFIGLHNTFHNNLDKDEVWQTGVTWWSIKRDYGHTDEETATPIQLGIGMSYKKNAMYNMYYGKDLTRIWTKALTDLRYGIRTHYHAANDVQGWGVSIDDPLALQKINKVENAARLLNRFNPSFPKVKLLVVYGMEAMYNWYPDASQRGLYDINDKLEMEKKSVMLWNNGYLNASVPTDLIEDGRLHLNGTGKPELNGYVFDAVVLLNPEYARAKTTAFFTQYVNKGGKLLLEGNATHDFNGNNISTQWKTIASKATALSFSLDNIEKLGITKDNPADGVINDEGTYTFTNTASLESGKPAVFSFSYSGNTYTGSYRGLAAIQLDGKGKLVKLAATAFTSLQKNGKDILVLSKEADLFISVTNGKAAAVIADKDRSAKLEFHQTN